MSIFRAYDIRGIYGKELTDEIAYRIGLACGKIFEGKTIALARDARTHGERLKNAFLRGVKTYDVVLKDVGVAPTPLLYFAVYNFNLDGGVMITASHNPKEYNGFKFVGKGGVSWSYESGIREIEGMVRNIEEGGGSAAIEKFDVFKHYERFVADRVKIKRRLHVVVDAGNGVAGLVAKPLLEKLGCRVDCLFCEPDGNFPNHIADPSKKDTLTSLREEVVKVGADVGIAFDGDGDRVGVVDERGKVVSNNAVFSFFIRHFLERYGGGSIVYEVSCSKVVEDFIKKYGGVPVISRVGHSYIQREMINKNAILGGETSGHYYFRETKGCDDAIFASAFLVEMLSEEKKPASEVFGEIKGYYTSEETRMYCNDDVKFKVVGEIKRRVEGRYKVVDIDGVKIMFKNGWGLIRASNTQPAIVIRYEAFDKNAYEEIGKFLRKIVDDVKNSFKPKKS